MSDHGSRKDVSLQVQLHHNCIVDEWDRFVGDTVQGHFEQTSRWGMVKQAYGWQPTVIEVREEGTLVGGVMIILRRHRLGGVLGYVSRGPLSRDDNSSYGSAAVDALCAFANQARVNYLVVIPPFHTNDHWTYPFRQRGFFTKPRELPPADLGLTATLTIDLTQSLETILAGMRKATRYEVRKAYQAGLMVRKGSYADIPIFWELMVALCQRRGGSPSPKQRDFFETLWRYFADEEAGHVFICEYDQKPVSALFGVSFGHVFRGWRVGWNGEHKKKHPNHLLWWEAIKWAKGKRSGGIRF